MKARYGLFVWDQCFGTLSGCLMVQGRGFAAGMVLKTTEI
jgi:hypothetical protein